MITRYNNLCKWIKANLSNQAEPMSIYWLLSIQIQRFSTWIIIGLAENLQSPGYGMYWGQGDLGMCWSIFGSGLDRGRASFQFTQGSILTQSHNF